MRRRLPRLVTVLATTGCLALGTAACARGKVRLFDVNVRAWRIRHGHYTRFRYAFPRRVPRGLPRSWTIRYYAGRWHGRVV